MVYGVYERVCLRPYVNQILFWTNVISSNNYHTVLGSKFHKCKVPENKLNSARDKWVRPRTASYKLGYSMD